MDEGWGREVVVPQLKKNHFTYQSFHHYIQGASKQSLFGVLWSLQKKKLCFHEIEFIAIITGLAFSQRLLVRAECVRQRNKVAIKLGIILSLFFLSFLL